MTLLDGKIYSIRMLTNAGNDQKIEKKNIETLEQVVMTLRRKAGGR